MTTNAGFTVLRDGVATKRRGIDAGVFGPGAWWAGDQVR